MLLLSDDFISPAFTTAYPISMIAKSFAISSISNKLIVRTEYPQIPPKVEYALSERGKSLMTVLDQLCVWGEENRLTE